MSNRGVIQTVVVTLFCIMCLSSPDCKADIWVIGENSTILRYDGYDWAPVEGVPAGNYRAIWGSSNNDIYIATRSNTLIHYNGSSWNVIPIGDSQQYNDSYFIEDVNGSASDDIYAFGYWGYWDEFSGGCAGCVFHYNGVAWDLHAESLGNNTRKGWASENGWLFSMGSYWDTVYNYSYDLMAYMSPQGVISTVQDDTNQNHHHVWGLDNNNVYFILQWWNPYFGLGDNCIMHFDGSSWGYLQFPDTVWAGTPEWPTQTSFTTYKSYGCWGAAPDDLYFAGDSGLMLHYGGSWQDWTELETGTEAHLRAVWGLSSNDVFAVGDGGTIIHYNGVGCSQQNSYTSENLIEVWGTPYSPIATLLQSFDCSYKTDAVTLKWSLSSYDEGDRFIVTRRDLSDGGQAELAEGSIERDSLLFSCTDGDLRPGATYIYSVDLVSGTSRTYLFETEAVSVPSATITLDQNYPNPFNPLTTIRYKVPKEGPVTLTIYDAIGREVICLVNGVKAAGWHTAEWDGVDGKGTLAASGIYFYRLRAGSESVERKMVMLR